MVHLRNFGRFLVIVSLVVVALSVYPLVAGAQTAFCYTVADAGGDDGSGEGADAEDLLTRVDPTDANPATNETSIGTGTGTFDDESVAFQPGTGKLYGVDGGQLGTFDLTTGVFAPTPNTIGSGSGPSGTIDFDNIDGLTFHPDSGALYGSERDDDGLDILIRINPSTGSLVAGAFGSDDYVEIEELGGLTDIDDITIATTGTMYAIANENGEGDHLVRVDSSTGAVTDIGPTGVSDMEGLTSAPDGALLGTTGKDADDTEALWDLNPATGAASNRRPLDNATDYEAVACPATGGPVVAPTETETETPGVDVSPTGVVAVEGTKIIAESGPSSVLPLATVGLGFLMIGIAIMRLAAPARRRLQR